VTQVVELDVRRREGVLRLKTLRMRIKAGVDALERGDFTEIADANLEEYLEGLAGVPRKFLHRGNAHRG
jgi:antitoxin ParD1/3/4